jgi:hypothetical protein
VAGLDGAGTEGAVPVVAGASVLVAVGSVVVVVFFFLEKRDFSLSRGESVGMDFGLANCDVIRYWGDLSYHPC